MFRVSLENAGRKWNIKLSLLKDNLNKLWEKIISLYDIFIKKLF